MNDFRSFFKNKKITIMGLGILGRGLGYTKFLAECGADLIVTDLKSKEQLKTSIEELKKFTSARKDLAEIKFILGKHRLEDFRDRDMIIKAAGVPLDSIYIKEAKKNKIPVEMDVSLFAKCAPEVMIIGVTGTRGKSMVTTLIYEILKQNAPFIKITDGQGKIFNNRKVYIGGNIRGVATLPLLKKAKAGDILVCELDSWQLQGFGNEKLSPHISVFTSFMPDHMNYYGSTSLTTRKKAMQKYFEDKANIFKFQKKDDVLIIRSGMKKFINKKETEGKLIMVKPGNFQEENKACAVEVAKLLEISKKNIKKSLKNFKGLEGRLQYVKTVKGVKIYNDNNATTPEATIAGIEALLVSFPEVGLTGFSRKSNFRERKIILICGGADKGLDLASFVKVVNKYCKAVALIPGTGTDKLVSSKKVLVSSKKVKDLKEAVKTALGLASRGDIILFSPAFASFGMFNNEYERNDLFMKIIKKLK